MKNKGFVALLILITISSLILVFQYIGSIEIGHYFDQVQRKEYRYISYYNAYSCLDYSFLSLAHDYFIDIDSEIILNDLNCSIISIKRNQNSTNERIIRVSGKFKNIISYRVAIVRLYDDHLEIVSIQ